MRPPVERLHRVRSWGLPVAVAALVPKCVLCVLSLAGLGSGLAEGLDLCGPAPTSGPRWTTWLAAGGGELLILIAVFGGRIRPRP